MTEEWITGGASTPVWSAGQATEGLPGVRMGTGCRARVLADGGVRVAVVGDFLLSAGEEEQLIKAAADGRWLDLTRLPGSYWVIAQGAGVSFVCGDVAGLRSVFYHGHGSDMVWSTSARRIAVHRRAEVDLLMAAARLAAGPEHWPNRTLFEGVRAVPGGYGLLLGPQGHRVVEVSGIHPSGTLAEGAAAFGAALERAVHGRMAAAGGRAGADVSGGLDSSSVAILAAEVGEIRAVTYADPFTSAEDLGFAHRVADHIRSPLQVARGGLEELPFGWAPGQPVPDQPAAASLTMAQHTLYLRPAAGLPLHFTGHGGDVVLDSCSAVWVAMVQDGQRRIARREVTNWARARNRSPRDMWRAITQCAGTGHAGALEEAAVQLETGVFDTRRPGVWTWCHLGESARWLTPYARERVAGLMREGAREIVPLRADLAEQHASLRLIATDARDTAPLAASWGIRPVHPFLDNQVVRAAFAIPSAERHGLTTFKPLLATALPRLPRWLTGRRSKGSFTRQLTAGILHHQAEIAELIRTSPLVADGLLDPEPALTALAAVGGTRADALYDLQRLTMTCQWLNARAGTSLPPAARELTC
ncbi:asparagine synthase-related protein [Streptomyces tsukubensis]|uniref:asparagine synthase-related protein n=1 Tax=Streptomyces tsukubensis TaxID=83656 RepID=UPI00344FB958